VGQGGVARERPPVPRRDVRRRALDGTADGRPGHRGGGEGRRRDRPAR
jgi:hypothetical protein